MADHVLAVLQYSPPPPVATPPVPELSHSRNLSTVKSHQDDTREKHLIKGHFVRVNTPNLGLSGRGGGSEGRE